MRMSVISFSNVSYSYDGKVPFLKHVSMEIEKGEFIGLIGHNGSGKSTIARLIVGLLHTKLGTIRLFDEVSTPQTIAKLRKRLGIVFQNPDNQFIGATIADDIAFGLENRNVPHDQMGQIIKEAAALVNMEDLLNRSPEEISGGQKQKVAIAGILALHPDLLILDEASSMLDPKGRSDLRLLINKTRAENPDMTIVMISHDLEDCAFCNKIMIIDKGAVVSFAPTNETFANEKLLHDYHLEPPFFYQFKTLVEECGKDTSRAKTLPDLVGLL
jgi:energy-coupling factor transport system ATP-binding protein